MVQFIQRPPSFGEQVATGLSEGLSRGFGQATDFARELALEKAKQKQLLELVTPKKSSFASEIGKERPVETDLLPQEEGTTWSMLSPDQKAALQVQNPAIAKSFIEEEKLESKKAVKTAEKVDKYLTGVTESNEALRGQLYTIDTAMQAVMEGKEGLSADFWIDAVGLPSQLKSASGATLDAAAKNHLLTSLGNLTGGRPNMFLEKQISNAFALPGGSKKGNLARLEVAKTLAQMKGIKNAKALEIADRYENAGRAIPGKIDRLVEKEASPLYEKLQKQSTYKIQDLLEPDAGSDEIKEVKKVREGTPLTQKKFEALFSRTFPKKDISTASEEDFLKVEKLAKALGYDIEIFGLMEQ